MKNLRHFLVNIFCLPRKQIKYPCNSIASGATALFMQQKIVFLAVFYTFTPYTFTSYTFENRNPMEFKTLLSWHFFHFFTKICQNVSPI